MIHTYTIESLISHNNYYTVFADAGDRDLAERVFARMANDLPDSPLFLWEWTAGIRGASPIRATHLEITKPIT